MQFLGTWISGHRVDLDHFMESVKEYGVLLLDSKGYVTSWKPGAERICGYTPEETVGKNAEEEEDELRRPVSIWLVTACCLSRWRVLVLGQWSAARVQVCLPRLRRFLCPSPRRRVHHRLWFLAWVQQRFLGTPLLGTFP